MSDVRIIPVNNNIVSHNTEKWHTNLFTNTIKYVVVGFLHRSDVCQVDCVRQMADCLRKRFRSPGSRKKMSKISIKD